VLVQIILAGDDGVVIVRLLLNYVGKRIATGVSRRVLQVIHKHIDGPGRTFSSLGR
jgi:hypothetical protein